MNFRTEGSAHYIGGELTTLPDHLNRTGVLRIDRDDTQRRSEWDRPLPFTLLPYGSIGYHGAPAELRHIPIGTHLHGQFYIEKVKKDGKGIFNLAIRLEDDFTYFVRQGRTWRVDAVNAEKQSITVTGVGPSKDQADSKAAEYIVGPSARIWKGRSIGQFADITPGQNVLMNLTVCTLKGPGRCTDVWLDPESRDVATAHQLEVHRRFQREHGLAGWVEEVDNKQGIVTMTFFDGFDPKLLEFFPLNENVAAAVAENSLRTYDQINDVMRGPILEVQKASISPATAGVRIKFKPRTLLEGYRPQRIIRLFSGSWKVDDLPKEERLYDR